MDAADNPVPLTQAQQRALAAEHKEYEEKDDIAYPDLMKACILNPRTKMLAQTGNFQNAYFLLERLRNRFYKCDETAKATHIANYHRLEMSKTEKDQHFLINLLLLRSL